MDLVKPLWLLFREADWKPTTSSESQGICGAELVPSPKPEAQTQDNGLGLPQSEDPSEPDLDEQQMLQRAGKSASQRAGELVSGSQARQGPEKNYTIRTHL